MSENQEPEMPENDEPVEASDEEVSEEEISEASALSHRLLNMEAELADTKDRLMRAIAETENVRRRSEREKADANAYAVTKFARDLLNVSDNMRRAMESVPDDMKGEESPIAAFTSGIEMTERELLTVFERHGITKIDPMGEKFDHNFHQAMSEVETTDAENGTVLQVYQSGFVLKDRLLRPAMVVVAKAPKKPAAPAEEPAEGFDKTV